jgi:hypothetical protein
MGGIGTERLPRLAEALAILFYVLMLLALVCAFAGSPGSGFLLLVLGSFAHVVRVGAEAAVNEQRGKDGVNLDRRGRVAPPIRREQRSRPSARAVAASPLAADLANLRAKLASKISVSS